MDTLSTVSKFTQDLLPDNLNKDSVNVVTSGESDSISCSSTFDVTSQIERKLPTPSHSNNELEISFLQKNKPSDKTLNPISNCKTRQMDIFNSERKKVTITDPCDKLTRDIQLKAEKILSDLRSVPLKYADKINKTRGVKSLENVLLQEKEVEDDVSDGGGGGSNDINDDSDDLLNELPKRKFPRISGQLNRKQLNSPEKQLNMYKDYENIRQKTDLLKMRCEMLQTYLTFLEARKQSLQDAITDMEREYTKNQQIQNNLNENQLKFDSRQFEEILANQSIALAREKEQSTQLRLKYESAEAARFALNQQLQLTCSEYGADKTFYLKQIKQLEQEIEERINKANDVKKENEQLQQEVLDYKRQITSLRNEMKDKEFEMTIVGQCYDQKWKEENEKHALEIIRLQREITDLSVGKSKEAAEYECEIDTLNSQLRTTHNKVHDLLSEKEDLCKQLHEVNHKLNISSQEKDELQKKSEADLSKIKKEKETEFAQIQTNLHESHKSKLNELQMQFDKDIETLKKNYETETEKLKTELKDVESLNKQLTCYIDTLESCIQNTTKNKSSNQLVQTDIQVIPVGFRRASVIQENTKSSLTQPTQILGAPITGEHTKQKLNNLISFEKSTNTTTDQLSVIPNAPHVRSMKEKEYEKIIDSYEHKLSQMQLRIHQLCHDHDSIIHLFNNTAHGIVKFGNRECTRFSKLLNISNHDIEFPTQRVDTPFPMKKLQENGKVMNLSESSLIAKSWINPMVEVIGKLSAYCIRICDLVESQQEHLEWQSENLNELRDITRKQIELQNKQLIKTRKANLNRLRNCLKQKQNNPSLNELSSIGMRSPDLCSISYNSMNDINQERMMSSFKDIALKPFHDTYVPKSPMLAHKTLYSNFNPTHEVSRMNLRRQNPSYFSPSQTKGQSYSSPLICPISSQINSSPYENMKTCTSKLREGENLYFRDVQFSPHPIP